MKPRLVLGVGNILMRDDGVGVRVVEALRGIPLPGDVELADGGTFGGGLVDLMAGREHVVIIDAVRGEDLGAGHPPGTVVRFTVDAEAREPAVLSLHETGPLEALHEARLLGCAPRAVTVIGVVPERVETGLALSGTASQAVLKAAGAVLRELETTPARR